VDENVGIGVPGEAFCEGNVDAADDQPAARDQDVNVECGNQTTGAPNCTGAFGARPSGAVVGSETLKDCMTQSGVPNDLRVGNVEILASSLVNCDTGKTIAVPVSKLFKAWKDEKVRGEWLNGAALTIRKATTNRSIRITWGDGKTNVEVMFYPKDRSKAQVTVQHNKLSSAKESERMKRFWGDALSRLSKAVV